MKINDTIRKIALFVSYSALFFIFLLAILIFITRTAYFRSWLQQTIVTQIEKRGKIQLICKEITGGLFTGMTMREIEIRGKEADSIHCDTLTIKLDFFDLVRGKLTVPSLVCSNLRISIIRTAEGSFLLPPFPPPSSKAMPDKPGVLLPAALSFENITFIDGKVIFRDYFQKKSPQEISLNSIEADCAFLLSAVREKIWWEAAINKLSFSLTPSTIDTLSIKGRLAQQKDKLRITNLAIKTSESTLSVGGQIILDQEPYIDINRASFALSLTEVQKIIGRNLLPSALSELRTLKGKAEARGKLSELACTLFLSFALDQRESTAKIKATLNLSDLSFPHYHVRAECHQFPLSRWLPAPYNESSSKTIDLYAHISGMGIQPQEIAADFVFNTTSLILLDRKIEAATFQGRFEKESLRMNKIAVQTPFGMVRAEGGIDAREPFPYNFSATVQQLDLKGFAIKDLPSSRIAGQIDINGILGKKIAQDFEASGSIELFPSRIGDMYPDHLFFKGHFGAGMLHMSEGKIRMEGLRLSAHGTVCCQGTSFNAHEKKEVSLSMHLEEFDCALLTLLKKDLPLQGIVTGEGKISGSLKDPLFDFTITGNEITYKDFHINKMLLQGMGKGITSFESARFSARIEASSILLKKKKYLDSLSVEAHKKEQEKEIVWNIKGDNENMGVVNASGAVQMPEFNHVVARIDDITFPLGSSIWKNKEPIQLETDDQGVRIGSCALNSDQGTFSMQGVLEWTGAQEISISLSEVSLDHVHSFASASQTIGGIVDVGLTVSGSFNAPVMKGYVMIKNGIVGQFTFDQFRHDVAYDQERLDITASLLQEGKETIHLAGTLPIDLTFRPVHNRFSLPGSFVDVRIHQFDLGFIPSLVPNITKVQGALSGKGQLSGSLADPQFDTSIEFVNTSFQIMPLSQIFSLKEGRIRGNNERIIIDEMQIGGNEGSALLSAIIELSQFSLKQFSAALKMEQWKILYSSDSHFVFEGEMKAQGTLSYIDLSGSITLPAAKVKINDFIGGNRINPEVVVVKKRGEERDAMKKKSGFFSKNVSINTQVNIPRNVWIIHDQANIELKGDLKIYKVKENNPYILGEIQSVRGHYTFYNKEFEVQKAILTFQGLPMINPQLDMHTVYRVGGVNIFIIITGTKNSPVVTLQSEPPMPQNDIISYLIFGRAAEDLSQRESANLQAQTFALLGRIVAMQVMGIFGEKFSIDTIQIRASKQGTPSLEIGKYLARDVYVSYSKELGLQESEKFTVEYYLYSNLTLETEIRADDRSGIDLIWKKDF